MISSSSFGVKRLRTTIYTNQFYLDPCVEKSHASMSQSCISIPSTGAFPPRCAPSSCIWFLSCSNHFCPLLFLVTRPSSRQPLLPSSRFSYHFCQHLSQTHTSPVLPPTALFPRLLKHHTRVFISHVFIFPPALFFTANTHI